MRWKGIILFFIAFILSACGVAHGKTDKKIEGRLYSEEIIELKGKYNLDISCDIGNIAIYTWKRDDIKFEITRRISGTYKKELIDEKLEDFEIDLKTDDDTVFLKSRYKGGNKESFNVSVDYIIYMPKSIDNMNYKVGKGKIKIFDDVRGILKAELGNADLEINRFNGVLNISGDEGNVKISSGKISGNSRIIKKIGNINIKSEFDSFGEYEIYTGLGHIDLLTPGNSLIKFETVGELTKNEFLHNGRKGTIASSGTKQAYSLQYEEKVAKVRLKSELGKISIGKY